jgi:hypothetical protein
MASQAATQAAQTLQQRVTALQQTATQYITNEQNDINNTVQVIQAILNGRTGGAGVQSSSATAVAAAAFNSLADFLQS